nr:class B sortase [Lachnospiraceae bacterium]
MGKKNKIVVFSWIAFFSVIALILSGCMLWGYYSDYRAEKALEKEFSQMRSNAVTVEAGAAVEGTGASKDLKEERTAEEMRSFYNKMKEQNEDYVCWLTVKDTGIDYPVLQRDNSFYLNHNFKMEESRHGSVFADENCNADGQILLLHGHHMKDGTMFGGLKQYKDKDWRKTHREIVLEFADGQREYRIFAAALVDLTEEGSFAFEDIPETEEAMGLYMEGLEDAAFWFDEDAVSEEAAVLVLSTCEYGSADQRLLVAAVRRE